MRGLLRLASLLGILSAFAWPALAQEIGLSPTLASIKRAHTVRLGYRESSLPLSLIHI